METYEFASYRETTYYVFLVFFFKQKTAYEIMPSLVGSEMCIRDSTYPIMAGLFVQQPTRARVIAPSRDAAGHLCGRRGRACGKTLSLF